MSSENVDGPAFDDTRAAVTALLFHPEVGQEVLRWVARLGIPGRDQGDIASDVWLAAWRSRFAYDPERASPKRWLNRITVHVCAHYHDRAHHRREVLLDEPLDLPEPTLDAPDLLEAEETRIGVLAAISALEPSEREVILAYDIEGIPMADLARRTGVPLSTLYKWRARALAALREALACPDASGEPPFRGQSAL